MQTHHLRSLALLLGGLGCAVIGRGADSPSQEVLASYPYQPNLVALPAVPNAVAPLDAPIVMPTFHAVEPADRSFRDLELAMARARARQAHALFVWELRWNTELQAVVRPTFQEIDIPWSPMTSPSDIAFSPSSIGSVSNKLQARVPLASLSW